METGKKDVVLKGERIPRIIHYCWFGGSKMPKQMKKYISSWKKYCPDYQIFRWDESNFDFAENNYAREAYKNRKWAFVSDYARLKILFEHGGIYMDTDVEIVRPLDYFLQFPAFSGFEAEDRIPTGTMGAEKGNRWIEVLLRDYDSKKFVKVDGSFDMMTNVELITNKTKSLYPIELNNTFQEFEDFVIFSIDWLCGINLATGAELRTVNTHTIHHYAGSWLPLEKRIKKRIIRTLGPGLAQKLVGLKHRLKG